jgi:hypothetical protein
MALTADQYQYVIASELNGTLDQINRLYERGQDELTRFGAEDFAKVIVLNWQMHSERGISSIYLQYLYVKRQTMIWLQGQVWDDVTWQDADVNEAAGQQAQNLAAMTLALTAEIRLYELRRAGLEVAAGQIATTTPTQTEPGHPDPFNQNYIGNPRRWLIPWSP